MQDSSERTPPRLHRPDGRSPWREPFVDRLEAAERLFLVTDFDGTVAEIRERPDAATIRPDARAALSDLADRSNVDVAVVSGRALSDVTDRVGVDGLRYAGNHGLEIAADGRQFVHPDAAETADALEDACEELRDRLDDVDGAVVEDKDVTATVHYRMVEDEAAVERVRETVRRIAGERDALRVTEGKQILEFRPDVDWDKGRAVSWLRETVHDDPGRYRPIYLGDDVTDEAAFRAVTDSGTAVLVGDGSRETAADYRVTDPEEVTRLLAWLAESEILE